MTYSRSASAPYLASMSSGSTTLPFDFDMTAPSLSTMPCVSRRVNGSSKCQQSDVAQHPREEPRVQQVQNRVLDAAAVEVDRHPVRRRLRVENGSSVFFGSQNRRKYHDESTNVSIVSVSRRAGPPHFGHVTFDELRDLRERRIAAAGEVRHLRQLDRQLFVRHRHDAVLLAVDHGNRRAPVALARNAPVLQPVLHLALADALGFSASAIMRLMTAGDSCAGVFARIHQPPVVDRGLASSLGDRAVRARAARRT